MSASVLIKRRGTVSKDARFRSYAGILYQLFFVALPSETNYDQQAEFWLRAINKITFDVLESVHFRSAHHDRSFPRRYQYLMEELQTYSFDANAHKAQVLNMIEAEVRHLFLSGVAFGLKENNKKSVF
ncbi:MAG: hypothetical protein KH338_09365 [Oscillospiraceae bacterium]|nr:hypothetical protein [Oscillospiraceae bacterium]